MLVTDTHPAEARTASGRALAAALAAADVDVVVAPAVARAVA